GAEWGRNTDLEGIIYANLNATFASPSSGTSDILPGAVIPGVNLFSDRLRTRPIAAGEQSTASSIGTVLLSEQKGSGLSGRFDIAFNSLSNTIELQVFPRLLSWR